MNSMRGGQQSVWAFSAGLGVGLLGSLGLSRLWAYLTITTTDKTVRVLISGAAGQTGYALAPLIARGHMLGSTPVILHLLDIESASETLQGVKMELEDAALPLLHGVHTFTSIEQAAVGVDIAVMVGGVPRKQGEDRKDVMQRNVQIYKSQAAALNNQAARGVKVVVVASPANTIAWVLKENAPGIPPEDITCLARLDHNRAKTQVAQRLGVHPSVIQNVCVWGNHSSTQYPDASHGLVNGNPIPTVLKDDPWLAEGFISSVKQRGASIVRARAGLSTAMSAASAVCDHVHDWVKGTPWGTWVSMGVVSDGSYGITPGLFFSLPVHCAAGKWAIVQGLQLDEASKERLRATELELLQERDMAAE